MNKRIPKKLLEVVILIFLPFHQLYNILQFLKIGNAIGDCLTDSFSITSQGTYGTPIICGTNGGYHSKLNVPNLNHIT